MRISVHQQGGFAGLDRRVEVDGDVVKVTDNKAKDRDPTRYPAPLDAAQRERLERLASRVAAVSDQVVSGGDYLPPDAMITQIAIENDGARHDLKVVSGDDAPGEVWELLGVLGEVSDAD
ncbi:MAG: hypothetical protein M3O34_15640 [Chloroflexota bacterium]|nr:hypothetical protein [Chloroflexota bacterium]